MTLITGLSTVAPQGYYRHSCGYCHRKDGTISYYAKSTSCRPEDYETLMNRGWRRSGNTYYKQNLKHSCCPYYTIRLNPQDYVPRKDQRRALNRWNKFILGQEYQAKAAHLCPLTKEEKKQRSTQKFNVVERIQRSEYTNIQRPIDPTTKKPLEPAHRFEVDLEPASFSQAKFNVFRSYQIAVHNDSPDDCTKGSFMSFLCSGLPPSSAPGPSQSLTKAEGQEPKKLGSYHQVYRLDGKIVAVAVLDLLPSGVSSVYLFYDPEYGQFEFGKLSAMREIALTITGDYKHYYMGFYIHSCVKMRYKADYRPQFVLEVNLDPETYEWSPLDDAYKAALNRRPYVSRSRDKAIEDGKIKPDQWDAPYEDRDRDVLGVPNEGMASLFDVNMPGVLTREQVENELDLDHWKLWMQPKMLSSSKGRLVNMCDLVLWDRSEIGNARSMTGVMAELAAVLGKEFVQHSAVAL